MLRFYDIRSGTITIDGNDIRDVTTESLRRQVGLVLQEPFLFSGTIRDNIRYGKLEATDDEVIAGLSADAVVLGGGSNVIAADSPFSGRVVRIATTGIGAGIWISAAGGEQQHDREPLARQRSDCWRLRRRESRRPRRRRSR